MPEWIERKLMPELMAAIEANDGSTHIFYITSEGGEGKTILLRQIGQKLGSQDGMGAALTKKQLWSGILDLYHSAVNTNSGLEARLSRALETEAKEFQLYRDQRDAYAARREAGLIGQELESERTSMADVFAECMNHVTQKKRVVIALDTTERIQFEVDEIQKLCEIEDESTTVKTWLLDQLQNWKNCVILLVGRPEKEPYLASALAKALAHPAKSNRYYHVKTLGGFDQDEVKAYFKQMEIAFPALCDLNDPEFRERLWEVTGGSPIRLDLAIDVIEYGLGLDQFLKELEAGSIEDIRREIDRLLIEHVMKDDANVAVRDILRYLAIAPKGLDAPLLHHLAGAWDLNTCRKRLTAIAKRSFVKQRPEDGRLFLHDEMYHLCDAYLLHPPEVQRLSGRIVEWYDQQIEAADAPRDLEVDSVLYRLRENPQDGYHWYTRRGDEAIRSAEVGFDMRLRNEVLAFLQSRSPIDRRLLQHVPSLHAEFTCDSAARWIKRFMIRGENMRAVEIASKVKNLQPGGCPPDDPKFGLAWAELEVFDALALIYSGGNARDAVRLLQQVIENFAQKSKPELALQDAQSYAGWRRNLVLGRAYNNLGYAHWMNLGHYEAALKAFRSALIYFRASELTEEIANTNDNMGRVYALRDRVTRAAALVDEGLTLRRKLKLDYRVALSLNSRAIVHLHAGEPHRAQKLAEEALDIAKDLRTQRGIGLASITLGRVLRGLGDHWENELYSMDQANNFFRDSIRYLEEAEHIFDPDKKGVNEPVRLFEARNELGCAYRDRARLARAMAEDSRQARIISADALKYLEASLEVADKYNLSAQGVDTCEDLAQTYNERLDYDNAKTWLHQALERVPDIYKLKKDRVLKSPPIEEQVEAFWLQLGKIELLSGNIAFDIGSKGGTRPASLEVLKEVIEHYSLSAVYFEQYSQEASGLRATFKQIYERLKDTPLKDLMYLQEEALPKIAATYQIDLSRLASFFEDTLGLAIDLQR